MSSILTSIFFLFLLCTTDVSSKKKSVCDNIIDYERNKLPSSINDVATDDYYGAMVVFFHHMLVSNYKFWPYQTEDDCKTRHFKMGKVTTQYSLRPRGCCTTCCLIDNTEAHLKLYYVNQNNKSILLDLNKRKRGTLAALGVSSSATTILHFHGFSEDGSTGRSGVVIAEAYLGRNETYNVFKLDYSQLAAVPWYLEAVDNCKLIGKAIAKFVIFYHKTGELPIENMHLIGISLGAHVASHVAKAIGKYKKVKRVTGLDPAYALYPLHNESERLSKTDAKFVDVIHTNHGLQGFPASLGHADFYADYPPSGTHSGCNIFDLEDKGLLGYFIMCDHVRSLVLYITSVENPYEYPILKKTENGTIFGYMGMLADNMTTLGDYHMKMDMDMTSLYNKVLGADV